MESDFEGRGVRRLASGLDGVKSLLECRVVRVEVGCGRWRAEWVVDCELGSFSVGGDVGDELVEVVDAAGLAACVPLGDEVGDPGFVACDGVVGEVVDASLDGLHEAVGSSTPGPHGDS